METKVILSEKFSLQWRDALKSLVMTVITAVLTSIYEAVQKEGDLANLNWKVIVTTAIIAGVGYLIKNGVFEPAKVITQTTSNADAVQASKDIKKVV